MAQSPPPLDPQQRTLVSAARSMMSGEPVPWPPSSSEVGPANLDAQEAAKMRNIVQRAKAAISMTSGEPVPWPPYSSEVGPANLDAQEAAKMRNIVKRAMDDFKGTIPIVCHVSPLVRGDSPDELPSFGEDDTGTAH